MSNTTSSNHVNKAGLSALSFAIAAALGAAIGLVLAPQSGEKTRKDLWNKAQDIATALNETRESVQKFLTDTFGKVTDDLEQTYIELRGRVLATADDLSGQAELTQKKYQKIVEEAVDNIAKGKEWAKSEVESVTKKLNNEWEKVQSHLNKKASNKA